MALETLLLAITEDDDDRLEDLSEVALDAAKPAGATVVVAHAFTGNEYNDALNDLGVDVDSEDVRPDAVAARHERTRKLVEALEDADVDYEIRGVVGDHGDAVVDLAGDLEADRIVVGGRKRSPTGKALFGSRAQQVMLSAPCPVTFVGESG